MKKTDFTITIVGAGGKMGTRITNNLMKHNYNLLFSEKGEVGLKVIKERGLKNSKVEDAVPVSDLIIMAVPDIYIGVISNEVVPLMKNNATLLLLDPAAAYAETVTLREDCSFVVAHPGHPPLYRKQDTVEAYNDFFGGILARQDVFMALYQGKEENYEIAQQVCREMWAPVDSIFRVTVDQMILLEPAAAEVAGGSVIYLLKEVIAELVQRGIPEEAARSFMLGHLRTVMAIVLGVIPTQVSDACRLAIEQNYDRIVNKNWKGIFEPEVVKKTVKGMLKLEED